MNKAVISLGSNVPDKIVILQRALGMIDCKVLDATDVFLDEHGYANIVAVVLTEFEHDILRHNFKKLGCLFGGLKGTESVDGVEVDIDLVVFNDEVRRPSDFSQPYFRHGLSMLHTNL